MSRYLSYLLRHGAVKEGLPIDDEGYVAVTDLLALLSKNNNTFTTLEKHANNYTFTTLQNITNNDLKGRFSLIQRDNEWFMRANQGHSVASVTESALTPITDPDSVPNAVHGTFRKHLSSILENGLSRMERNHIHFAQTATAESGVRKSATVFIYVDLSKAINEGIKFYLSENGVILTPGDENGFLLPKYFKTVVDNKGNNLMPSITQPVDSKERNTIILPFMGGTISMYDPSYDRIREIANKEPSKEFVQRLELRRELRKEPYIACGGCIVFRKFNDELQVCLIATHRQVYGFPKGKREKGEALEVCALRELKEETGIASNQIQPLKLDKYIDECSKKGVPSIRLYITLLTSNDVKLTPIDVNEIAFCEFVSIDKALELLNAKRKTVLLEAIKLIEL